MVAAFPQQSYQVSDLLDPGLIIASVNNFPARTPSGTLSLTATSGFSITATIPSGYLASGSWYDTGMVTTSDGGIGIITAVPSATTLTISTSATGGHAFGTTSYTNSIYAGTTWSIPSIAPDDQVGLEDAALKPYGRTAAAALCK